MKLKYYYNLDGLRALAALAVIVAHFFSGDKVAGFPILARLAQQGNSGVSLFFVLSGFVITRILMNSVNDKNYYFNFYGKRCLRIFPLYYLSLLCYNFIDLSSKAVSFSQQWYHYLYLQNFARTFEWDSKGPEHFWSLAVEEHFYLLWPALVYLALKYSTNRLIHISVFFIVLSFVLRAIMLNHGYEVNVFTLTRMDQLSLGCILAVIESKNLLVSKFRSVYLYLFIAGVVFVGFCGTLGYYYLNLLKHNAYGLLYFGLIGLCITSSGSFLLNRFLTLSPIQYLGKISYGIYIWHMLSISFFAYFINSINLFLEFILICITTIIMATFSYYLYEVKFLKLKRFLDNTDQKKLTNA